jgi:hypothetical protein
MYKRALLPLDGSMVAVAFDHHWRRPHNDRTRVHFMRAQETASLGSWRAPPTSRWT